MGQTKQSTKPDRQARIARDKEIVEAFKSREHHKFLKHLSCLILAEFPIQLNRIKELMIYEEDHESVNEIIARFMELKIHNFNTRFLKKETVDYREFLATLYLSIKHIIQDVLCQYGGYKKHQRLRKEVLNILKASSDFELVGTGKSYRIRVKRKRKPLLEVSANPFNINLPIFLVSAIKT